MKRIYDISQTLRKGLAIWPGDPPFRSNRLATIADGDPCNLSDLHLSLHTGTHVDAPRHFDDSGSTVSDLDPALFVGPCRVIPIAGALAIGPDQLTAVQNPPPLRILLQTGTASQDHFTTDFAYLTEAAAHWLVDQKIVLVGIDTPSVDAANSDRHLAHHLLSTAGIPILENLDLTGIPPGDYELIALPLKIEGAEAAPVRALLREL